VLASGARQTATPCPGSWSTTGTSSRPCSTASSRRSPRNLRILAAGERDEAFALLESAHDDVATAALTVQPQDYAERRGHPKAGAAKAAR